MRCVALFLVCLLPACGQSGDLYLRSEPPAAPPAAEPMPAEPAPAEPAADEAPAEANEGHEDAR